MSAYVGFHYDAAKRRAHFDCRVPGSAGTKRRRKTVYAETRADALALWRAFTSAVAEEAEAPAGPPAVELVCSEVPTLAVFVETHYTGIAAAHKPSTRKTQESIIRNRLLPVLGTLPLDKISSLVVADFQIALKRQGFAPSYRNDCLRVLKMLLYQAVEREVIISYPLRKRVRREKEPVLRLEMTTAERATFLEAFDDLDAFTARLGRKHRRGAVRTSPKFAVARSFGGNLRPDGGAARRYFERFRWLRPLFVIALETGLRRSDLLQLRWSSVHRQERWIRVLMQKTEFEAVIPISSACGTALDTCEKRSRGSEYVFVDERGKLISDTRVRRSYALAKELAGITRRCRFHDLRHTFASRLVSQGTNLRVIATSLGHTTTDQTERYAKPSTEAMRQIMTALDRDATCAVSTGSAGEP